MKRKITTLLLCAAVLAPALSSCRNDIGPDDRMAGKADPALKGIWKLAYVRFEGGLLSDVDPFYAIIEPEGHDMVIVGSDGSEVRSAMSDHMKMEADGGEMTIIEPDSFEKYLKNRTGNEYVARFPYDLLDGESLHLYPQAVNYLLGGAESRNLAGKSFHIELYRQKDLEAMVSGISKAGSGQDSWLSKATAVVIDEIADDGTPVSYKIDEYLDFVTSVSWDNTGGWKGYNWMSNLPDTLPVAWVNLPGSHDSSTARDNMGADAATTDACVQSLSIMEQFRRGARYFDFRVGSELKWDIWPISKRMMTDAEMSEVTDLQMYHGPLCTNTPFIASMRELADEIRRGQTEFIFINVQAERESSGMYDWVGTWLDDWVLGTSKQQQMFDMVNYQSMKIANRLMKEFSRKYYDEIFIPYTPSLTVGQARGHIIIMEDKSNMVYECKGLIMTEPGKLDDSRWLRASFYTGWPSNSKGMGYATMFTYSEADSLKNDLYVQSYYEMKVSDKTKIETKEKAILSLTGTVTAENMNPERKNVLGFNALNANTGSVILKTYVFAHEFNGYAFEMFVDNMKNTSATPMRCGIVAMDHYGVNKYDMTFSSSVTVYGDLLSWAVIESNFYKR